MTGPIIRSLAAGLVVLTVLAAGPLSAQKPTDGTGRTVSEQIITELERQIIERYVLERRGRKGDDHSGQGKKNKAGKKKGKSGELPPGLADKVAQPGRTLAYRCRGTVCEPPVDNPDALTRDTAPNPVRSPE